MIGIIEYLPQLSPVRQGGDLFIGSIQLVAGKNQVDTEKWKEYADLPLVKQRIEQGILRVTFDEPTVITLPETKKSTRVSTPVETKLVAQEITPEVTDTSAFVIRPPEVEKNPTPPKK